MQAIRLGHRGAGRNHFPEIAPLGDFLTVKIRFRFRLRPDSDYDKSASFNPRFRPAAFP